MEKRSLFKRLLSLIVVAAMCLTYLPAITFAADEAGAESTWTKIDLKDVTPEDKIAITMTKGETTWILPNANATSVPKAEVVTASGDTMKAGSSDSYAWTFTESETEGSYYITSPSGSYLYTTNANNGVRVGSTQMAWSLDGNYLKANASGKVRYLGVYTVTPDWRAYDNTTGNTAGQTVSFWKLDTGSTTDPEPSDPVETDPTDPSEPEPSVPDVPTTGVTWTKVDFADIKLEDAIAITMTKGTDTWALPNAAISKAPAAKVVTVSDEKLTTENSDDFAWTFTASGAGYQITNADGSYLYATDTNNGVGVGKTQMVWTLDLDGAYLKAGELSRWLGVYNGSDWRTYTSTTGSSNIAGQTVSFWKLDNGSTTDPDPTDPTDPTDSTDPSEPDSTVSKIAEALAGSTGTAFTVKGVVTMIDGKNVYVQDETGGINLYLSSAATGLTLGDTVIGTGNRGDYKGLPQLASATYEKSSGLTLTAKTKTIGELGTADICTYVEIKGVEVTAVSGSNIDIKDDTGSIQIYKAIAPDGIKVGDILDIKVAVGIFDKLQLRNTLATEITVVSSTDPTDPTDPSDPTDPTPGETEDGDYILVVEYNGKYYALGTTISGKITPVEVTIKDGDTVVGATVPVWTIATVGENVSLYNGTSYLAYDSSTNFKASDTAYEWVMEGTSGTYRFTASTTLSDKTVRAIAFQDYNSGSLRFGAYGISNASDGTYAFDFHLYTKYESTDPDPGPGTDPEPSEPAYKPENGDKVVIFYPGADKVMTGKADGTRLVGADATPENGLLYTDGSHLVLNVTVDSDGKYVFTTDDGLVLNTGATGGSLTLVEPEKAVAAHWRLEEISGGWLIMSTDANYNGNYNQGIEFYSGNFTTYGYKSGDKIFTMQFYKVADVRGGYSYDSSVVDNIAQWAGGNYKEPFEHTNAPFPGDLFKTNDELDQNAFFEVFKNGVLANPYTVPSSGAAYMGAGGVGSGTNDYMQFRFSSAGYGDMTMSFRMRFTASSPKDFQLQYSTDGKNFSNFSNGSYTYSYTSYGSDGSQTPVTKTGTITNGLAECYRDSVYIEYTFDVPQGAENAQTLYIRLVPNSVASNGNAPGTGNNVRIDTVVISGSPIVDDSITGFVTADPDGVEEDQAPGTELTLTSKTANATIHYRFVDKDNNVVSDWAIYDANNKPVLPEKLPIVLEVYATCDGKADSVTRRYTYEAGTVQPVKVNPNGGGIYLATKEDTAEITLSCATDGATIWYVTYTGARPEELKWQEYTGPIVLKKGFGSLTVEAYATKDGFADSTTATRTFTERDKEKYDLYFGQLHSHTSYSDGAGTIEEAFKHVTGLSQEEWNMDFLAVTDHSNSFDDAGGDKTINDAPTGTEWNGGKETAAKWTTDKLVGIFGYEMTWSNGLGHINTFSTTGYQDRTQTDYKTYSTALQNYYAALKTASASISQFNHPGTTFGDFSDFAHYDEQIDQLITLIEVGNGEGKIGSSGYFPSYEYYTRALDKGWHVAPTNNQDNHKGNWGSSNTGRTVVLTDVLTEEAIYDAMRNYRVYATEDLNLEIYYTFDGQIMGTIMEEGSYEAGQKATIRVELNDPNEEDLTRKAKVEVIVNGGLSIASAEAYCNETVTLEVPTVYSYYYIRVTQADGDIAVTAPVWVSSVEAVGISSLTAEGALTVENEKQTFTLELYNNETKPLEVTSIEFTNKATGELLHTATDITAVPKLGTASTKFSYAFKTDGIVTITATVKGVLDGVEKTYTQDLEVTVMPADIVTKILVDGTHFNDYVTGYYGGRMGNMTTIAANNAVQVTIVTEEFTAQMLEDCNLLVISAPAKKNGTDNAGPYVASTYDDAFIALVKDYVANGGTVIVCGLADYQDDKSSSTTPYQSSVQQNALLEAIGSTMRINDDEAYDEVTNGGQAYRLYPAIFNMDSEWTKGIITKDDVAEGENYQTYSQYSGCTIDPGKGTWLVKGFDTTYSIDSDKDGKGGVAKGDAYFMAYEQVGKGNVFVAGGVFLSDFEVSVELDNIWDLPYANRTIYENILNARCATENVTPIGDTRKADLNKIFVIEGWVTSGTANANTTFFDAIYVQDASGGTTCFPYANAGLEIGTKVRILGYTDAYQDDREIQIISLRVLDDEAKEYDPNELTTKEATDYDQFGGQLVQTTGMVSGIVMAGTRVSQFNLTDHTGVTATVFIDGYIWNENGEDSVTGWLEEGQNVSAVGLMYMHPEEGSDESTVVLRVRNTDEITPVEETHTIEGGTYDPAKDENASVSSNVPYELLVSVWMDGELVDPANYTVSGIQTLLSLFRSTSDGTVVTFNRDYLNTLTAGEHIVVLHFEKTESGEAVDFDMVTTLMIETRSEPGETEPSEPAETEPSEPGETEPSEPAETEPSEPGETEPSEPAETEPSEPGETEPSEPAETEPSEPAETEPSEPAETDPSVPGETEPGDGPAVTGDTVVIGLWIAVMILTAAAIVTLLMLRKKFTR